MRKQHTDLRGSPLSKATSTGGKTESFYYWCNSKWKIPNHRAALPYISKGSEKEKKWQNKKPITEITAIWILVTTQQSTTLN